MPSRRLHPGYLVVDHRDSPGLTSADVAHMPNAVAVGKGELFEADAFVCAHCSTTVLKNPNRTRPRGYCAKCDAYLCDNPICNATCAPVAKLLDDAQEKAEKDLREESPKIILTDI